MSTQITVFGKEGKIISDGPLVKDDGPSIIPFQKGLLALFKLFMRSDQDPGNDEENHN